MKIRQRIDIAAPADAVWPMVADPGVQATWNEAIVSVARARHGPAAAGERFDVTHWTDGRERTSRVKVVDCAPGRRIAFRHTSADGRTNEVAFDLAARGPGATRVTQTIDLSDLPWLAKAVIVALDRLGRPAAPEPLRRLKALAEGGGELT